MKRLVAGPWVGEFGWELFLWNGYIRSMSLKFDETICIGRSSSFYIYKDFCDKYINFDARYFGSDMWKLDNLNFDKNFLNNFIKMSKNDFILTPKKYFKGHPADISFLSPLNINGISTTPKYIKYGKNSSHKKKKLVFHARARADVRKGDNWDLKKWTFISKKYGKNFEIYSIGTKGASFFVPGTKDFRDRNLESVCNLLSESLAIIGPSSGPMHLASLCSTSQIVWSGNLKNKVRYEKNWNPFFSKVFYIDKANPSESDVSLGMDLLLDEHR